MATTLYKYLADSRVLAVDLPDGIDNEFELSLPFTLGSFYGSMQYGTKLDLGRRPLFALSTPSPYPTYLESTINGVDVTVFDMNHGVDDRDRPRFLILWRLEAGVAWLQVDGADSPESQLQTLLTNAIVSQDADGLPNVDLAGGQKAYGANEASSDVALFYPLDNSSLLHYVIIYNRNRDPWMRNGSRAGTLVAFQQVPGLSLSVEARADSSSGNLASSIASAVASSIRLAS